MRSTTSINTAQFFTDGFAVADTVLQPGEVSAAIAAAGELFAAEGGARAGVRDPVERHAVLRHIASLPTVTHLANEILGSEGRVVRSILFDKSPGSNWDVAWHQDVTIAVQERHELPGFGPWSIKGGVTCVQPPAAVLENMVTIRLHLDDCGPENGPLLVIPDSHRRGVIAIETLDVAQCERDAVACTADQGAALLMRPLLLHASKKSLVQQHRRVLHLDFAALPLPTPLRWRTAG